MNKGDDHLLAAPTAKARRKVIRRLAAIFAADIRGYSLLMAGNEEETHLRVNAEITRLMKEIGRSGGRVFSFAGDGLMAEFTSAVEAVKCALRVQTETGRRNAKLPPDQQIVYRIGLNSGEVVVQGDRAGGNAVNVAARLEQAAAEPGGVCLSGAVFEQVKSTVPADYVWVGNQRFKNIREPVPVYRVPAIHFVRPATAPIVSEQISFNNSDRHSDYRPSLAVLPFRSAHENQADAYFAEGMVDDIIRVLGGLKDLIVVSRSSTLGFVRASPDVRRIGWELGVHYVLHGSVRRAGEQLRITVELDDADTRQSLWADSFEGNVAEIFELQDRIALRTVSSIAPYVHEQELRRALLKDQNSINAYDLTLRALGQISINSRKALIAAQQLLQQAIALDSHYSAALSHLAYLHIFRIGQGWSDDEHQDRLAAAEAAQRAIERDRNDALGIAIHGHLHGYLRKDHQTALDVLDRAIAVGPNCALAWTFSSFTSGIMGNSAAALVRSRQALRLSPIGPDAGCWHEHALSQAHYLAGQYEEAIEWGRTAARHGRQSSNLRCLIASLVAADQMAEARSVAGSLLEVLPHFRLSTFRAYTPLKGEIRDLFVERLQRAGLPE